MATSSHRSACGLHVCVSVVTSTRRCPLLGAICAKICSTSRCSPTSAVSLDRSNCAFEPEQIKRPPGLSRRRTSFRFSIVSKETTRSTDSSENADNLPTSPPPGPTGPPSHNRARSQDREPHHSGGYNLWQGCSTRSQRRNEDQPPAARPSASCVPAGERRTGILARPFGEFFQTTG